MQYILTLNNINVSDLHKVGHRALYFANIFQGKYKTPLSFVIPNVVFDEFLIQTGIEIKISRILAKLDLRSIDAVQEAYSEIKTLFREAQIPKELTDQLKEAYYTLSVSGAGSLANDLLNSFEPTVNLILSPDYITSTEDSKGILLNIRGFEFFLVGVKSCWMSLYSPEAILNRHRKGIKGFNTGIIVQKMISPDITAESYSKGPLGNYEMTIKAYKGFADLSGGVSKDIFSVSKELLKIQSAKISRQEYKIAISEKPGLLIKSPMGSFGAPQKLSDKEVIEIARLTKRAKSILNFDFKALFQIKKGEIYFMFINKFPDTNTNESDILEKTTQDAAMTQMFEKEENFNEDVNEDKFEESELQNEPNDSDEEMIDVFEDEDIGSIQEFNGNQDFSDTSTQTSEINEPSLSSKSYESDDQEVNVRIVDVSPQEVKVEKYYDDSVKRTVVNSNPSLDEEELAQDNQQLKGDDDTKEDSYSEDLDGNNANQENFSESSQEEFEDDDAEQKEYDEEYNEDVNEDVYKLSEDDASLEEYSEDIEDEPEEIDLDEQNKESNNVEFDDLEEPDKDFEETSDLDDSEEMDIEEPDKDYDDDFILDQSEKNDKKEENHGF